MLSSFVTRDFGEAALHFVPKPENVPMDGVMAGELAGWGSA